MNGSESDVCIPTLTNHLQTYTDLQVFLGMGLHVQAVDTRFISSNVAWEQGYHTHTNTSTYNNGSFFLVCLVKFQHLLERVVTDDVAVQHEEGFRVLGQRLLGQGNGTRWREDSTVVSSE